MAIYDCFILFNEIDLLKIRLEMLYPVVDKFVIVEANKTFRGLPKEYNFLSHKQEFEKYLDKIVYINPSSIPEYKGDGDWSIEYCCRNAIKDGLVNCKPEDIIMISDLDEIPNPLIYKQYFEFSNYPDRGLKKKIKLFLKNKSFWTLRKYDNWIDILNHSPIACQQGMYHFFFNIKCQTDWYGTVICKYKYINTIQQLRKIRGSLPYIKNAGWHLSYFGGIEFIKGKLNSIIDESPKMMNMMREYGNDDEYIKYCITNNIDLFGRENVKLEYSDFKKIDFPNKENLLKSYPNFFNNIN